MRIASRDLDGVGRTSSYLIYREILFGDGLKLREHGYWPKIKGKIERFKLIEVYILFLGIKNII